MRDSKIANEENDLKINGFLCWGMWWYNKWIWDQRKGIKTSSIYLERLLQKNEAERQTRIDRSSQISQPKNYEKWGVRVEPNKTSRYWRLSETSKAKTRRNWSKSANPKAKRTPW